MALVGIVAFISFYDDLKTIWEAFRNEPTPDDQNQQCDRITQLERSLQEHPGVFNWHGHNELRHLYHLCGDPRRSMEHSDIILRHSPMDGYILNILSGWQIDKDSSIARANLLINAQSFSDLRFVAAACFLKIGDLYSVEGNLQEAKSSYLKVAEDKSSDMARYRVFAEERLNKIAAAPVGPSPSHSTHTAPTSSALPYEIVNWPDPPSARGWDTDDTWQAAGGVLLNNGKGFGERITAMAPIRLDGAESYAVDAEIQFVRYVRDGIFGSASFGIVVRASDGNSEYWAGHDAHAGGPYRAVVWAVPDGTALQDTAFHPHSAWHNYRVEVRGNTITLVVDGAVLVGPVQDNRFLTGGSVGLWSDGVQISVRRFKVSPLEEQRSREEEKQREADAREAVEGIQELF